MLDILKLFGSSPFSPLHNHMEKVTTCVSKLNQLFEAFEQENFERVEIIAQEISTEEHSADLIKNHIRTHLPTSLILPISREAVLDILSLQDSIADKAEDVAVLFTLKKLKLLKTFKEDFNLFLEKNLEAFDKVKEVMNEFDQLIETSFGGAEAEKVRSMVDDTAYLEHEVDLIQRKLLKDLYNAEDKMGYASFYLWQKIIEAVAGISNISEKLALRMRSVLENR